MHHQTTRDIVWSRRRFEDSSNSIRSNCVWKNERCEEETHFGVEIIARLFVVVVCLLARFPVFSCGESAKEDCTNGTVTPLLIGPLALLLNNCLYITISKRSGVQFFLRIRWAFDEVKSPCKGLGWKKMPSTIQLPPYLCSTTLRFSYPKFIDLSRHYGILLSGMKSIILFISQTEW